MTDLFIVFHLFLCYFYNSKEILGKILPDSNIAKRALAAAFKELMET